MTELDPLDNQLASAWSALEPSEQQIRALQQRLAAPPRVSLVQEWLDLLRVGPAVTSGFGLASAFAVLALTPAGILPHLLLKFVGP